MVCELRIGVVGGGIGAMGCSCCWRSEVLGIRGQQLCQVLEASGLRLFSRRWPTRQEQQQLDHDSSKSFMIYAF